MCAAIGLASLASFGESFDSDSYFRTREANLKKIRAKETVTKKAHANVSIASPFAPKYNWFGNRVADFCDMFSLGIGATHENPITGPITPSFGIHAQFSDYWQLGYLIFGGVTAEWEGRGFGAYGETREIWGFGPWSGWDVYQGANAVSYYKDPVASQKWRLRMDTEERFGDNSGHIVAHTGGNGPGSSPWKSHPRGWHNYAYTGLEVAIPLGIPYTPLDTHLGITLRAGVDTSQLADFILGIFCIDFWHDDLQRSDVMVVADFKE
jgi:hypothetical protein